MKNEMDRTEIDILLAAYFAGEADSAERAQVESWMTLSDENRAYFARSKKAWDASALAMNDAQFNTDAAWKKLKSQLDDGGKSEAPAKQKYRWLSAAAVALLIGIFSVWLLNRDATQEVWQKTVESGAGIKYDTLPDGSVVSMNRNSSVSYASVLEGDVRRVDLTGEAFFEVAHNAEQPFIVHTGLMDVKVLGTSFNVRAYPEGDSVYVSVETGKVQCVSEGDTVVITPGQFAVYVKGSGKIRTGIEDDPNRSAYRNRIFYFNNTPLGVAVQQLNEAYGCNIILKKESLKTRTFTVTKVFNNEPVGNIIEAIKVIYPDITSDTDQNTITLDCTGCQ